ncbi:MAG: flagellar hook-basal body complex protein FliE [Thermotogae bacterium]|nr:flagellar hook-basal body complex protein FliE [Thermotogaceae bacterium]RKX36869.1 MAG: flagellar hook-basal body complex protein FliE [Thermotogota bacterium]RKX38719.1 MAG: flagellar hook-basal body complex protein FliE [Thermotogota bacterium]
MIERISNVNRINQIQNQTSDGEKSSVDFAKMLSDAVEKVNSLQKNADQMANDFALGKISNIHDVIIEAEKASVALKLTTEVRDKIIEAYREIMRMQL